MKEATKIEEVKCSNKTIRTVMNGLRDKSIDQQIKIKWWNNVEETITIGRALAKMREMMEDDASSRNKKY